MSWPDERTHPFYVHDRVCTHCDTKYDGFARSQYCSPNCMEMAKRARHMLRWGVPDDMVKQLTEIVIHG